MSLPARLRSLWRNLAGGRVADRELDDELRSYVDLLSDEYRAEGTNEATAERRARVFAQVVDVTCACSRRKCGRTSSRA